jgi:hypothetical protein
LLKHEERRAYQNKYNVVGIAIYTLFRDLLASGFTQHEERYSQTYGVVS